MNSYTVAFGILGLGVFLAVLMWSIPLLKRRRQVRRFRQALAHLDTVAGAWAHAFRQDRPPTDVPTVFPEDRRRRRRGDSEDGGGALV